MDRVNQKMKKNLRGFLDGFRAPPANSAPKVEPGIEETIMSEHFQVMKTVRHGFPHQPTALAYDSVQRLLAIGTKNGSIRLFGRSGVDSLMRHEGEYAVLQLIFLVNEGALISVCADDQIHLWSFRQKKPEVIHSLKFQRERIIHSHLPFRSKWLYVGTERGNVHVVNIESFTLSGYIINWNKAIDLLSKNHPGPVVHVSDSPADQNKLLIGYESGLVVLWDLKIRQAELRYKSQESLRSISWHHEGKQFICSHVDGSLVTWNVRNTQRPHSTMIPHAKLGKDGKPDPCRPITKVDYRTTRNGEPFTIFSGGMPQETLGRTPSLTIMHGSSTTVLEMEHPIVDFCTICTSPWNNDIQDPYAVIVLLQSELVVTDLLSPGYPCFENPYPMDIHESPVTTCVYLANCPADLIPAFYSMGCKQKKPGFSDKEWPIKGGDWGTSSCSYSEIIITGHADGSVKFWDASSVTLQVLYKLKTGKVFDETRCMSLELNNYPFSVHHIDLCVESRLLAVAGLTQVVLFKYCKQENTFELPVLEISLVGEISNGAIAVDSPADNENNIPSRQPPGITILQPPLNTEPSDDKDTSVRIRTGPRKWLGGYQPEICCLLTWTDGDPPAPISSLSLNSKYGLLSYGNESGLVVIDVTQKVCLIAIPTAELYGSVDTFLRSQRSPKSKNLAKPQPNEGNLSQQPTPDGSKSPIIEQPSCATTPVISVTPSMGNPAIMDGTEITSCDKSDKDDSGAIIKSPVNQGDDNSFKTESRDKNVSSFECSHGQLKKSISNDNQSAANKSDGSHSAVSRSVSSLLAESMSTAGKSVVNKSPSGQSAINRSSGNQSAVNKSTDNQSAANMLANSSDCEILSNTYGCDTRVFNTTADSSNNDSSFCACQDSSSVQSAATTDSNANVSNANVSNANVSDVISPMVIESSKSPTDSSADIEPKSISTDATDSKSQTGSSHPSSRLTTDTILKVCEKFKRKGSTSRGSRDGRTSASKTSTPLKLRLDLPTNTSSNRDECELPDTGTVAAQDGSNPSTSDSDKLTLSCSSLQIRKEADMLRHTEPMTAPVGGPFLKPGDGPRLAPTKAALHTIASEGSKSKKLKSFLKVVTATVRKSEEEMSSGGGWLGSGKINSSGGDDDCFMSSQRLLLSRHNTKANTFELIDLTSDDLTVAPPIRRLTYSDLSPSVGHLFDKTDGNALSQSQNSSVSSLDSVCKEAIVSLHMAETYAKRSDTCPCPSLWIGTNQGAVHVLTFSMGGEEARNTKPVTVSLTGTVFKLKGCIKTISFLDCTGILISSSSSDQPRDISRDDTHAHIKEKKPYYRQQSVANMKVHLSPTPSDEVSMDHQFSIICSEKQARVLALPSQTCAYKVKITESSAVVRADVVSFRDSVILCCFLLNGHIMTFSLPSLRPLLDVDYLPLPDVRTVQTFCFSINCHALYFCSPSELQKLTLSAEMCENLKEMTGELFRPCDMPEPPKQGFLKSLFNVGNAAQLDREELFGESGSGKATRGVAKYTGMSLAQEQANSAVSDIARARQAAMERGEKLGELDEKTEKMRNEAEMYASAANQLKNKYRDRKWYQF